MRGTDWGSEYQWYAEYYVSWKLSDYSHSWAVVGDLNRILEQPYRTEAKHYLSTSNSQYWQDWFEVGDVVQYKEGGRWSHTMIVTGVDSNNMYMAYHSPSEDNEPLTDIMDRHPYATFKGYHLLDEYIG